MFRRAKGLRLGIGTKLFLGNLALLVVIGIAMAFIGGQAWLSGRAVEQQNTDLNRLRVATATLEDFSRLRYWMTDLQLTWLEDSEIKAEEAEADLRASIDELAAVYPEEAAVVKQHVDEIVSIGLDAVDAYTMGDRNTGNELVQSSRASIDAVQATLAPLVEAARQDASQASRDVAASQSQMLIAVAAGAGVSVLLLVCVVCAVQATIAKPIRKVVVAMKTLASGSYDVDLPPARRDEIGDMVGAVTVFKDNALDRDRLANEQDEMKRKAEEERRKTMKSMASEFEQTVGGVVDAVSSAAGNMQETAQGMSATAEETSRQAGTVTSASEEAASNVQSVATAAEELSSSIAEIGRQVAQSTEISRKAVEEADGTNKTINGLATAADKIGEVVGLITTSPSRRTSWPSTPPSKPRARAKRVRDSPSLPRR